MNELDQQKQRKKRRTSSKSSGPRQKGKRKACKESHEESRVRVGGVFWHLIHPSLFSGTIFFCHWLNSLFLCFGKEGGGNNNKLIKQHTTPSPPKKLSFFIHKFLGACLFFCGFSPFLSCFCIEEILAFLSFKPSFFFDPSPSRIAWFCVSTQTLPHFVCRSVWSALLFLPPKGTLSLFRGAPFYLLCEQPTRIHSNPYIFKRSFLEN